jgi:transposase
MALASPAVMGLTPPACDCCEGSNSWNPAHTRGDITPRVTITVDLINDVSEITDADSSAKILERRSLTCVRSERFWQTRQPCAVVMEACGSAHHWARLLVGLGFEVRLLPAHYVAPYHIGNKTNRTGCDALLEAARSPRMKAVSIKSKEQQQILALHRVREQWKNTRNMRINGMRGLLREFGVSAPRGASFFLARLPQILEQHRERLAEPVRRVMLPSG